MHGFVDTGQQFRPFFRDDLPVRVDIWIDNLASDHPLLHQGAHGVYDIHATVGRKGAGTGERDVPAHGIAGHRDDLVPVAIDRQEIGIGAGKNQRRGVVATCIFGDGKAVCAVKITDRFLSALPAIGIESGEKSCPAGMVPSKIAKFGLVVGAPSRTDDNRCLFH